MKEASLVSFILRWSLGIKARSLSLSGGSSFDLLTHFLILIIFIVGRFLGACLLESSLVSSSPYRRRENVDYEQFFVLNKGNNKRFYQVSSNSSFVETLRRTWFIYSDGLPEEGLCYGHSTLTKHWCDPWSVYSILYV